MVARSYCLVVVVPSAGRRVGELCLRGIAPPQSVSFPRFGPIYIPGKVTWKSGNDERKDLRQLNCGVTTVLNRSMIIVLLFS